MIPDAAKMLEMARNLESLLDELGWDAAPPGLGYVFCAPDGACTVMPFPIQPVDLSNEGDAVQGLLYLGGHLRYGGPPPLVPEHRLQQFAGLIFAAEAWYADSDLIPDREADPRPLAEIPGARECRFVHLLDCAGRIHYVSRLRGEEPTSETIQPGDPDREVFGNIPVGLRDIMVAIGGQLPRGAMDLDTVAGLAAELQP